MNDPYKQQRLEICKQQTMLHNANCVECPKMFGLNLTLSERFESCKNCDIGLELRGIGVDLLKLTRPRKKTPIHIREVNEIVDDSRIKEFLELREEGISLLKIAEKWKVCVDTVRRFVKTNNLVTKSAKHGPKNEVLEKLTTEAYLELKKQGYKDIAIAQKLNCNKWTLNYFKRKNGLARKIKRKGAV